MHTNADTRGFMLLQHEAQLRTFGAYKTANPDWDLQSCSKGQIENYCKAFYRGNLSYARVETFDEKIHIMEHTSRRTQIRMMELHQTSCLDARSECAPEYQQMYEEKLAQDHKFVDTSKVKYHKYYENLFRFARKIPAHAIHTSSQIQALDQ
jgi:hypothetical protein